MAGIYIPNLSEDKFNQICKSAGLGFIYVAVPDHGREDKPTVIPADGGDVNGPDTSE